MGGERDVFTSFFVGIKEGFLVVFDPSWPGTVDITAIVIVTSAKHKAVAAIKLLQLTKLGAGCRGTEVAQ